MNSLHAGITRRLIKVVRQQLDPSAGPLEPFPVEQKLSDLGLTSLKMVNLMLAVEMEFDLMIPQADITPENFYCVDSIAAMVLRLAP